MTDIKKDYKTTLNLPQTDFAMKANLAQREPGMLKKWQDDTLYETIRQARAGAGQAAARPDAAKATRPTADSGQATVCPLCTKPMVRRIAKRGANAGGEFWGCTGYPACRGTRPIG